MELRHLRYFVAVAEESHFGRAAALLHIAQPPLSQQIKQLEQELGVRLLNRTTRHVELTPAGARFLERARNILAETEAATEEVRRVASGEVGRVSIGFVGTATYAVLPRLAQLLKTELPDLQVDLHGEILTPELVAGLRDHTLDLAILRPPVGDADISVSTLRRERLVAVLSRRHPLAGRDEVALADLRDETFISYPSHHRSVMYPTLLDACRAAGFKPRQIQEVSETSTLVVFVAGGLGVALVPESVQDLAVSGACFIPLTGKPLTVELSVATRVDEESPHVHRVMQYLQDLVPQMA